MIANAEHGIHVVGIDHGGDVVLVCNVVDELVDENGGLRVKARVGFVAEEIFGIERDGTRNGNALLHTARKFGGHLLVRTLQIDTIQTEIHALAYLFLCFIAEHTERKSDVLFHRHRVEEGRALEEHTNLLAYLFHLVILQFGDVAPIVEYFSLLGLVKADETFEQHGFARARLTDDEVVDSCLERATDAVEHRLFAERLV